MGNFVLQLCLFIINSGFLSFGLWLKKFVSDKSITTTKKLNTELGYAGLYGIIACSISIFLFLVVLAILSKKGTTARMGKETKSILFSIFVIMVLGLIIFSIIHDTKLNGSSDQDKTDRLTNLSYVIVSISSGLVGLQLGMFIGTLTAESPKNIKSEMTKESREETSKDPDKEKPKGGSSLGFFERFKS